MASSAPPLEVTGDRKVTGDANYLRNQLVPDGRAKLGNSRANGKEAAGLRHGGRLNLHIATENIETTSSHTECQNTYLSTFGNQSSP